MPNPGQSQQSTSNTVTDSSADTVVQAQTINVTAHRGFAIGPGTVIHGGQHIHESGR
ncbi:hypothetical protein [Streptomyces xiamenensis]|uniref:hypothetical protein n=1 Tax=Streptomyces xiamenensis TaxID=408015 RepID=UPI0037D63E71